MRDVGEVRGFGPVIFFSPLFTVLWTVDVAWWWYAPRAYASRSVRITRTLHGYMAFIIFNGTVVYETDPIRWVGVGMFAVLAVGLVRKRSNKSIERAASGRA